MENVRQQVFQAMQAVAQAADALKTLTVEGPADDLWTANIVPVESFELKPLTLTLPLPDALKLALANRPEVRQFALQKVINEIDVKFFRNQTKPQVDLTASYGLAGVAGAVSSFPDQNGVLQPANAPSAFVGGYGMGDVVGRLFREFAITLSVTILVSAAVSLTLTPMMCAKILRHRPAAEHGEFYRWSEKVFDSVIRRYGVTLGWALRHQRLTLLVAALTLAATILLYVMAPKGFFPTQDTRLILGISEAPQTASFKSVSDRQR